MTFSQQQDRYVLEQLGGTEERRIKCTHCGGVSPLFILPDILDVAPVPDGWQKLSVDAQNARWKQHPPVAEFISNHCCP